MTPRTTTQALFPLNATSLQRQPSPGTTPTHLFDAAGNGRVAKVGVDLGQELAAFISHDESSIVGNQAVVRLG
jgi:hypothetical protein